MHAKRTWVAVAAAVAGLAIPASANAAVTVGQTLTPNLQCGSTSTWVQVASSGPESYAIPEGFGVVTSWSFQAYPPGPGTGKLILWRPTMAPDQFIVVGKSATEVFDGSLQTFPTRISVQPGDLLGFRAVTDAPCLHNGFTGADRQRWSDIASDPEVGSTQTLGFSGTMARLLVAAVVEPDADHDGFGDETQDGCPTDGSTQAVCLAPDTLITAQPKDRTKRKRATFDFVSSIPGSTFECSLDGAPFAPCISPLELKVGKGRHQFEVRALSRGLSDPFPATDDWKVKKKQKK